MTKITPTNATGTTIFAYEIQPTNFFSLPDEKQETLLTRFAQLLNAAGLTTLTLAKTYVEFSGQKFDTIKTYISSPEDLGDALAALGFKFKAVSAAPGLVIHSENARSVITDYIYDDNANNKSNIGSSSHFGRLFVLTGLRSSMSPAWIHSLLQQHCNLVVVRTKKIDSDQAVAMAQRYKTTIEAAAVKRQSLFPKLERAQAVYQALQAQRTALFWTSVSCAIIARTQKELELKSKTFIKSMKGAEVRFSDVPFLQRKIATGAWRKDLILELGSLAIAYPFVSSDLLEVEGGILLGQNVETKAPVVYDYRKRDNYNAILLATSGSGKSVTAKVILKRMMEKYPEALFYVVDPQGEYEKVTQYFGLQLVKLTEENGNKVKRMGLDPYTLFQQIDVPQVISDIAKARGVVRNEISAKSSKADNIFDLYKIVDEDAKAHLVHLVEGPFADFFKQDNSNNDNISYVGDNGGGHDNNNNTNHDPLQKQKHQQHHHSFSNKVVISLEGAVDSEERKTILLTLILAKVWKAIISSPTHVPKVLVIDEGWLLFKIPSAARFVEMIARTGRKLNVLFLFITQKPADVLENEVGRAIMENANTKFLLRNDEIASQEIANALWLSQRERDILPLLMKGEALLLTGEHRLRVRITPASPEELAIFSTTPNEGSNSSNHDNNLLAPYANILSMHPIGRGQ